VLVVLLVVLSSSHRSFFVCFLEVVFILDVGSVCLQLWWVSQVLGVGPGLGLAIARRFAHEKYTLAILSRHLGYPLPISLSLFSFSDL
jgi:hypothetical protein